MVGGKAPITLLALLGWAASGAWAAPAAPDVIVGNCRDGLPQGRYELRTAGGQLRVAGAFNLGRRTGSFIFWNDAGSRIAHIPYDDDVRNGTLATWYPSARNASEPARHVESAWRNGVREGPTRTWYRDGHPRTEADYRRGVMTASAGWSDAGARLGEAASREAVGADAAAADAEYAALEALVRAHLPPCAAAAR